MKQRNEDIENRSELLIILYEPCKGEDHKVGYFYVSYIVIQEPISLPEGSEKIYIKGKYATAVGLISQMANIYSFIGNWINEQAFEPIWPDSLLIEIYEKPIDTPITGNEEVHVCLPVY